MKINEIINESQNTANMVNLKEGMYNPARYRVTMKDGTVKIIDWMYDEGLGQYFIDTYGQEPADIERIKKIGSGFSQPAQKTHEHH